MIFYLYICIMKKCYNCKKEKNLCEFNKSKKESGGYSFQCKICKKEETLKRRYGITIADYNRMFEEQEGKCLICTKHQSELTKALNIDHCHTTGKVRGLLCNTCNRSLGAFYDNIEILENAIKYLKK